MSRNYSKFVGVQSADSGGVVSLFDLDDNQTFSIKDIALQGSGNDSTTLTLQMTGSGEVVDKFTVGGDEEYFYSDLSRTEIEDGLELGVDGDVGTGEVFVTVGGQMLTG